MEVGAVVRKGWCGCGAHGGGGSNNAVHGIVLSANWLVNGDKLCAVGKSCLDLHVVTTEGLTAAYVGPYPISVLIDEGCDLASLHAAAKREHAARQPADENTRISRAVGAWSFLAHAVAEAARGNSAYAFSLLEGSRVALAQVLVGQGEPIPDRFSPASLPKLLNPEHRKVIDATVPRQAATAIPDTIAALAAALRAASSDLEGVDATGRLMRIRSSTEAMIRRELRTYDGRWGLRPPH